ncbi:histidine phosphatase family protein [Comamonas sp. GB3 AK4-5]|uniref:histidine phosphatase family protein n=1 Tax=Comamonas sp. GB3 AK4-5 TaxID=3231487 RepID=UPI00351EA386
MRSITFVRHGQSTANLGAVSAPHPDIPLSLLGQAQAQLLASSLPTQPALVLASPYIRAQDTAQPYCQQWGLAAQLEPLLHEMDAIAYECIAGMEGEQRMAVAAKYWEAADPDLRTGTQAETYAEFGRRVQQFRSQNLPQLPDRSVVFGHGLWMAMLCWQLSGFAWEGREGMQAFKRFQMGWPMPNGASYRVQGDGQMPWAVQIDRQVMQALGALSASL